MPIVFLNGTSPATTESINAIITDSLGNAITTQNINGLNTLSAQDQQANYKLDELRLLLMTLIEMEMALTTGGSQLQSG